MPSINDMIKNLGSKSDRSELKDMALRLKLQIEDGTMSIEEARKELQRFKDNQSYRASKGMADGGDVKKGIGSFLPQMSNGGESRSINNLTMDEIMNALIAIESSGGRRKIGYHKGKPMAYGITQVKPSTARDPGSSVPNIFEVADDLGVSYKNTSNEEIINLLMNDNVAYNFSKNYLSHLFTQFKDPRDAVLAYNQGKTGVKNYIEGGRDPKLLGPEGPTYVNKFMQAIGIEDFGFDTPSIVPEEGRTLGSVLPQSFSIAGQEFLKSEDPINPVYAPIPQARPTELVDKLGLPGDLMRDAEIDIEMAMNPALVGRATMPPRRPEPEDDATLASSLLPPQRPFGTN